MALLRRKAVLAPRLHVEATQAGFELNFEDADQAPGVLEALQEIFSRHDDLSGS